MSSIICIDDWSFVVFGGDKKHVIVVGTVRDGTGDKMPIFTGIILHVDACNRTIDTVAGEFRLLNVNDEYIASVFQNNCYTGPTLFIGPDTLRDMILPFKYIVPDATTRIIPNVTLTAEMYNQTDAVIFRLTGSDTSDLSLTYNTDFYVIVDTAVTLAVMDNIKTGLRQLVSRMYRGDGRTKKSDRVGISTRDCVLIPLTDDIAELTRVIHELAIDFTCNGVLTPRFPFSLNNTRCFVMTDDNNFDVFKNINVFNVFKVTETTDMIAEMNGALDHNASAVATDLVLSMSDDTIGTGFNRYGINSYQLIVPALMPNETWTILIHRNHNPIHLTMRQYDHVVNCTI